MATVNTNYQGASADPRGSWEPKHFLAGWNYADRLRDFQNTRDINNQAGLLSNIKGAAEMGEFQANAPVRDMTRNLNMQTMGNQMELNPLLHRTALSDAKVNSAVAETSEGTRAATLMLQQTEALKGAQRSAVLNDTIALSKLTKGYAVENADPNIVWPMILQQAKKMKIDTKDFENGDPAKFMKFFTVMDDKVLEAQLTAYRDFRNKGEDYKRSEMEQQHADYRAGLTSGKQSASGVKEANRLAATERYVTTRAKLLKGQKITPEEQAQFEADQVTMRDPFFQQGAVIQKEAMGTKNAMDILSEDSSEPNVPTTAPNSDKKPKGKEWSVDAGDDYDNIPSGAQYILDGKVYRKK